MSSKGSEKPPAKAQRKGEPGAFSWVIPALRSRRTLKTWFRCCVALAATLVLMVSKRPSDTMGQASFFCVIVAVMLPPIFALSVFTMAASTLLIGMLVGWAWGNAAMASALSVRSASLLAQQQQTLQLSLDPNLPIAPQTQYQIYHGIFLDPASSAVYGVFLFIGTYALGAIRAQLPSLTVLTIFGSIVLDVICTTGPLLPNARYTLPKLFIIPTCFYVAVAIASLVLIFPESLSHAWLALLRDSFWTPTLELLRLQSETLEALPSDHEAWAERNARGVQFRSELLTGLQTVTEQLNLIDLDTSIGRLGPADLKKVNAELKSIMFRAGGLHAFHTYVNDLNLRDQKEAREAEEHRKSHGSETPRTVDRYQAIRQITKQRELKHGHDLDTLMPILASASANLRSASEGALTCSIDWLQNCNSRRWAALFSRTTKEQIAERQQNLKQELKKIEDALENFRTVERVKLIKPYEKFFDPKTKKLLKHDDVFTSRSLYICFVFIDTLDAFAERMVKFLKVIIDIDAQRPKVKLWFPGRIAKVSKDSLTNREFKSAADPLAMGSAEDPANFDFFDNSTSTLDDDDVSDDESEKEKSLAEPPKKRNPDAFPPKRAFGKFLLKVAPFFQFLKSDNGIFAFRMGLVSVALWVPAVCHNSAWFYYSHKGLWALIMAQTALAVYAGDQIASFLERLIGTLLGLLIGMAVWYMGAGLGPGNPYGIVVATTVLVAPFLFARIAGPPAQLALWVMVAVTIVFVVGYSWVNANQAILGNPGVGVTLGWKRALLVIIGFTAAFLVMLFPNPISSRVLVRKTIAAIVGEAGNIFAGEVEAFLAEEARARRGDYAKVEFVGDQEDAGKVSLKERRVRKIAKKVIGVSTRLMFIYPSLTTARFEPQFSGTWPHDKYEELFTLQTRMLGSLALLIVSFAKLDPKWCSALVQRTPYLNPNFLSDIFTTLYILSNSLMRGHPLPAYLPKLRERLVYHEFHTGRGATHSSLVKSMFSRPLSFDVKGAQGVPATGTDSSSEVNGGENAPMVGPAMDGSALGIGMDDLTLDVLLDEQLPAHSTAMIALSSLISRIDEMIDVVELLCGEATFQGYELLQRDYLDQEERAIGVGFGDAPQH
ncbi:hypothetical protein M413DRAFT_447379 [Hebeloma cylindrosporum]|uniref:ER transporter 6TM N-terminal domain-containing protein n=1 Tax=Hebeloma cylindrosporum TaxID=76867 RepID=A0A0C3BQT1_HEBCY|nr:hypothetical protein M413DRAFT_447379 [Hebeloma cylindrosporum h7]